MMEDATIPNLMASQEERDPMGEPGEIIDLDDSVAIVLLMTLPFPTASRPNKNLRPKPLEQWLCLLEW